MNTSLPSQNNSFFPVQAIPINTEIAQKFMRECEYAPKFAQQSGVYWSGKQGSGGQGSISFGPALAPTKAYFCTSITFSCNQTILVESLFGYRNIGTVSIYGNDFLVGPNGTTIQVNAVIRNRDIQPGYNIKDFPLANPESLVAYATVSAALVSGLLVTKGQTTTIDSQTYSYVGTITNTSGSGQVNPVITDTLPAGCTFLSASGTTGSWTSVVGSGQVVTATYNGTLANNATATYTVIVRSNISLTVAIALNGYIIDDDINYSAPPCYIYGTSISVGAGITDGRTHYAYLTRNYVRDTLSFDMRIVNRGISGTSTVDQENLRAFDNYYDFIEQPACFLIEEGINDVAQSVLTATSVTNITNIINHVRRKAPKCPILVLGSIPNGNSTNEALLVTYRAAMQTLVTSLADPLTFYVSSWNTLWNPVTQSGTYTTDGTHPNVAGNALMATALQTFIVANNIL